MTADGKIAFEHAGFTAFASPRDRRHMMELRATADAVICGARTIEETGTILGSGGARFEKLRLKNGLAEHHLRLIATGSGSIDPNAAIFRKRISPVIVLTTGRIPKKKLKRLREVADEVKIFGKSEMDLQAALRWLRRKWGVKRLLCEGGGELHGGLVRAGLVDEVHLTICPKIFGGRTAPTIAGGRGFKLLAESAKFRLTSARLENGELFTVFKMTKIHGL